MKLSPDFNPGVHSRPPPEGMLGFRECVCVWGFKGTVSCLWGLGLKLIGLRFQVFGCGVACFHFVASDVMYCTVGFG